MAIISYKQGSLLYSIGSPLTHLGILMKGSVQASNTAQTVLLEKGDCVGVLDLCNTEYTFQYTALEDCSLLAIDYTPDTDLNQFLQVQKDWSVLLSNSITKQALSLIEQDVLQWNQLQKLSHFTVQAHNYYQKICKDFGLPNKVFSAKEDALVDFDLTSLPNWHTEYFSDISNLPQEQARSLFQANTGLSVGYLMTTYEFVQQLISRSREFEIQANQFINELFDPDELGIFASLCDLYPHCIAHDTLKLRLDSVCTQIISYVTSIIGNKQDAYPHIMKRIASYDELKSDISNKIISKDAFIQSSKIDHSQLKDSLGIIIKYAKLSQRQESDLRQAITAYKQLEDKTATTDEAKNIRSTISSLYYTLYEKAFFESMQTSEIPIAVKMFFYFSYFDETLCSELHLAYLYKSATMLDEEKHDKIFTFYHWLCEIYNGKAEPCMNEFEVDFPSYVQQLKSSHQIDQNTAQEMLQNTTQKVLYELQNMFPSVLKITFGQISSFCPVMSEHLIIKDLEKAQSTYERIESAFTTIREVDPTAYFQESIYENTSLGIQKELIHTEYVPTIILLPSIGTRGVIWQDIEGRKRSSPARMMVPIFYLADINTLFAKLTAEYRWQICKRIQGSRWNDLSDLSLTSEYCDYIQFYRKNMELSVDAKERIKNSLARNRNNYRDCFVQDYLEYIQYEAKGSPRLNKVVRKILATYCPFPKGINETLSNNPLYTQLLQKLSIKQKQKLQRLESLQKKILQTGKGIPNEILAELEFYNS